MSSSPRRFSIRDTLVSSLDTVVANSSTASSCDANMVKCSCNSRTASVVTKRGCSSGFSVVVAGRPSARELCTRSEAFRNSACISCISRRCAAACVSLADMRHSSRSTDSTSPSESIVWHVNSTFLISSAMRPSISRKWRACSSERSLRTASTAGTCTVSKRVAKEFSRSLWLSNFTRMAAMPSANSSSCVETVRWSCPKSRSKVPMASGTTDISSSTPESLTVALP
mmetsp:Transcript_20591/g.57247  ORF Transcript_20591/g.57247 Transcript_20591/m.57247 type:complete len:227 (+) Transcript_20591:1299-1979(+)